MAKFICTFSPHRCEPKHLEMISEFADRNGISQSEAMRFMIETGSRIMTEDEKEICQALRKSSMSKNMHFLQIQIAMKIFNVIGDSVSEFKIDVEKFHHELDQIFEKGSTKEDVIAENRMTPTINFDSSKV